MTKLIVRLLIVFTLLSNLGWAADAYYTISPESEHTAVRDFVAGDHNDCPAGIGCHHCCHALAHLLALPGSGLAFRLGTGQHLDTNVDTFLKSFIPAPPFQPPRA